MIVIRSTPEPSPQVPQMEPGAEDETALEWADRQAEFVGNIWAKRFPSGRDWAGLK